MPSDTDRATPSNDDLQESTSPLRSLRVLITGAAGFIGSRLAASLTSSGAEVHGVSRRDRTDAGLRWWKADLAEYSTARRVMDEVMPDVVFHLAGEVSGARDVSLIRPTLRNNLLTTVNLLDAACRTGSPRVVLAGSRTEVGSDRIPASPYAAAKAASSVYARTFHSCYDLPVTVLRPSMVYGPGQEDYTKLVPYVTRALLRGQTPRLGAGTRRVDWVYVDDVVEAFVRTASAVDVAGESLDIGSGELVSVRSVVDRIVQLSGRPVQPQFGAIPDRSDQVSLLADTRHTREVLGWSAGTSLESGLAATVDWYRGRNTNPNRSD